MPSYVHNGPIGFSPKIRHECQKVGKNRIQHPSKMEQKRWTEKNIQDKTKYTIKQDEHEHE